MAILVSREDHCLYDLLIRHRSGELPCEIGAVISNHDDLAPVAAQFGVPFHLVPVPADSVVEGGGRPAGPARRRGHRAHRARPVHAHPVARLRGALARRAINIHHSFLPAFVGARPYHQAHERGVKLIGATAHYVTTVLDDGPIIDQDVIRASHRDSVEDLVRRGRDIERTVLARAVRWHLEDRVLIQGNRTIVFH